VHSAFNKNSAENVLKPIQELMHGPQSRTGVCKMIKMQNYLEIHPYPKITLIKNY
jgi:hypothetical protein